MKSPRTFLSAVLLCALSIALLPPRLWGQATTAPVGYVTIPLLASSDTLVSIPFTQPAAFTGSINAIAGSTITVASSPGWTANQYVYAAGVQSNTYYVIVGPNVTTLTGTVSVTNGSTAVTGSGTLFKSQVAVNDELLIGGLAYNVSSIPLDTSIVLSRAYTGTTGAGLAATDDRSPKEGCSYTVTANGANALTVNLNGDSLSTVTAGTSISLIPYWTLGTAFPASAAGTSFIASPGTTSFTRQTQILFPDLTDAGINLSATAIYYFYNGSWRLSGADVTVSYNDTILPPATYFTVRNSATATTFAPMGGVYMNRLSTQVDAQASSGQDNAVAVPRPTAVALNDLGLITSGAFTASPGTTTFSRTDTLLVYDNTVAGINKSSSATYFYYNGAWRLTGTDGTADYGATTIPYGTGFTIRKGVLANGATSFWQNTRTY